MEQCSAMEKGRYKKTLLFEVLTLFDPAKWDNFMVCFWDVKKERFDIFSPQTILMCSDPQWVVALSGRWFSLRSLGTKRVWQDHFALLCSRQVITTQKKPYATRRAEVRSENSH